LAKVKGNKERRAVEATVLFI